MALFTHPISKKVYWLYKEYDESIRLAFNLKLIELFRTMIRTFIILGGVAIIVGLIAWTAFQLPLEMVIVAVLASLVTFAAAIIVIVYCRSEMNRSRDLFMYRPVGAQQEWLSFQMLNSFAIGQELLRWPSPSDVGLIDWYFEQTQSASNMAHQHQNSLDPSAIMAERDARNLIIERIGDLLRRTDLKEEVNQEILVELQSKEEERLRERIRTAEQAIAQLTEADTVAR